MSNVLRTCCTLGPEYLEDALDACKLPLGISKRGNGRKNWMEVGVWIPAYPRTPGRQPPEEGFVTSKTWASLVTPAVPEYLEHRVKGRGRYRKHQTTGWAHTNQRPRKDMVGVGHPQCTGTGRATSFMSMQNAQCYPYCIGTVT